MIYSCHRSRPASASKQAAGVKIKAFIFFYFLFFLNIFLPHQRNLRRDMRGNTLNLPPSSLKNWCSFKNTHTGKTRSRRENVASAERHFQKKSSKVETCKSISVLMKWSEILRGFPCELWFFCMFWRAWRKCIWNACRKIARREFISNMFQEIATGNLILNVFPEQKKIQLFWKQQWNLFREQPPKKCTLDLLWKLPEEF